MAKYLSKLTVGGNQYELKDAKAWADIADIQSSITGAMHYLGASSTAIADGDKTGPWTIDGVVFIASGTPAEGQVLLKAGDVATYDNGTKELEFVWSGAAGAWREYGSTGSLKALAFKDSATGNVTCAGSNAASAVSFSGTASETVLKSVDDAAVLPSFTEGAFSAGTLPSFTEGAFSAGTLPSFTEGSFTPASLAEGFYSAGSAATYSHSGFSGGSLAAATTGSFATEGITATVDESNELLTISDASTSSAVTAQGAFTPAVYGTDSFNGGTPTAIDVTKFNGGSKAADSFSAGTLPSKTADTWSAGTLPSKAADTFDAGSAATFTTETVITGLGTATAAAQTFTGSTVSVTVS